MLKHIPFYATLCGRELYKNQKAETSHVLVYGAIETHSMGEYGCIASNETISAETNLTLSTVKKTISQLKAAGWIDTYVDKSNNRRSMVANMDMKLVTGEKPAPKVVTPEKPAGYSGVTPINIDTGVETEVKDKDKSLSKKVEKSKYETKDVELCNLLRKMVEENFPSVKEKPLREIDYEIMNRIHRLDGKDYELIYAVILWVQQDEFWSMQIRSVNKLRVKFNDLQIRAEQWYKRNQRVKGTFKL